MLCVIHDDMHILEPGWNERVERVFSEHPDVGLAGFGGSTALAGDEIYKDPYEIHQLGRRNYFSNMREAEGHGERITADREGVFVVGDAMLMRKSFLDRIGGWSWWPVEFVHHTYDYAIACMARRHGYRTWIIPVACHHTCAMTGESEMHHRVAERYGGNDAVHARGHRWVYDQFRDVLPLRLS